MRRRRATLVFTVSTILLALVAAIAPLAIEQGWSTLEKRYVQIRADDNQSSPIVDKGDTPVAGSALEALDRLAVKGRAPKTGYTRDQFGDGWATVNGCSTRNIILYRDLDDAVLRDRCVVESGILQDTYTGKTIHFSMQNTSAVQIDHVVALSDAWQKGAQQLTQARREQLANDPLELLAVEGAANQAKSDGDAATWLPSNKPFRCHYVARQITIKMKYELWVSGAESAAMKQVLSTCPEQPLIEP